MNDQTTITVPHVQCPACGAIYPYSPDYLHTCRAGATTFYYFYRLKDHDRVHSLCLVNVVEDDPLLAVRSRTPEGKDVDWARRREGDFLAFYPPEWFEAHLGHTMHYSKEIQRHEALPREQMEHLALSGKVTFDMRTGDSYRKQSGIDVARS